MKFRTKQKHMIDFIFPISLFFIFALCALTVLLFAARIYRSTTENSSLNTAQEADYLTSVRKSIKMMQTGIFLSESFAGKLP